MKRLRSLKLPLLAFLLGGILVLGFSPFKIWPLGIIIPALLFWFCDNKTPKAAFFLGLAFGLGEFGFGISWVYISLAHYGNGALLALLITALFILLLALFPALQFWLMQVYGRQVRRSVKLLLIYPGLWVVFELLRGSLFTGFPWLLLGYTQTFTALAGFAKVGSVFLVSGLCVFCAGLFLLLLIARGRRGVLIRVLAAATLVVLFGVGAILKQHAFTKPLGSPLEVALVQGNIAETNKWTPQYLQQIITTYTNLTGPVLNVPLIVWPESSIPDFPENIMPFINNLDENTSLLKTAIVFGLPIDNPINHNYFNGALALGDAKGMYLKQHLVPFGEYIPLPSLFYPIFSVFNIPMSGFTPGPDDPIPMEIHGLPVHVFICYESAFPFLFRQAANSAYIITLTDDGWYGRSLGAYQHEEIEVMRALETGRPILRATNTGVTSIIDPNGEVVARAPLFTEFVLRGKIQPVSGETPWLKI